MKDNYSLLGSPLEPTQGPEEVMHNKRFLYSTAMSKDGNIVAVATCFTLNKPADLKAHVEVYKYEDGSWEMMGNMITGETKDEFFGRHIGLSENGKRLIINAVEYKNFGGKSGKAFIYEYDDQKNEWILIHRIDNRDIISNTGNVAVAISGDGLRFAISGARIKINNEFKQGIQIYQDNGTDWELIGSIAEEKSAYDSIDMFGESLKLSNDGRTLIAGAPLFDKDKSIFDDQGCAKVFREANGEWSQVGETLLGTEKKDQLGRAVAISADGKTIVAGAPYSEPPDSGVDWTGSIKWFQEKDGNWSQIGSDISGSKNWGYLGWVLALSGNGMRLATYSGGGAVHIYDRDKFSDTWSHAFNITFDDKNILHNISDSALALSHDGSRIIIPRYYNQRKVEVYDLRPSIYITNELEEKGTYIISGSGGSQDLYWKVVPGKTPGDHPTIEFSGPPDWGNPAEVAPYKFIVHKQADNVFRYESVAFPGYFLSITQHHDGATHTTSYWELGFVPEASIKKDHADFELTAPVLEKRQLVSMKPRLSFLSDYNIADNASNKIWADDFTISYIDHYIEAKEKLTFTIYKAY